jgi:hypothetical protein
MNIKKSIFLFTICIFFTNFTFADKVQITDPVGAIQKIDQVVTRIKFEDAYRKGDRANFLSQRCELGTDETKCRLKPSEIIVDFVNSKQASLKLNSEGKTIYSWVVPRTEFESNKNLLRIYFESLDCNNSNKPHSCLIEIIEFSESTVYLSDGKKMSGWKVNYLENKKTGGSVFVSFDGPWIAGYGIHHDAGNTFPTSLLLGFTRL